MFDREALLVFKDAASAEAAVTSISKKKGLTAELADLIDSEDDDDDGEDEDEEESEDDDEEMPCSF